MSLDETKVTALVAAFSALGSKITGIRSDVDGKAPAHSHPYVNTGSAQALESGDALTISGNTITLTKGDGATVSVTVPDNNTWRAVVNGLTSTSTSASLTANQGRVLKGLIDGQGTRVGDLETLVQSNDVNLDSVQELVNFIKNNAAEISALTPADIGAAPAHSHPYDNYNGWDLQTNSGSADRITAGENVNFIGGSNVTITNDGTNITISSTDTNTNTHRSISDSVSSTSSSVGASSKAVKTAYDKGNHSHPYLGSSAKAVDSDKLDGYNSSTSSGANTVMVRDSSNDVSARLFRSEYDSTNSTPNLIMTQVDSASNNYIRPTTHAQFRAAVTDAQYLGKTAKAADSDKLDGLDQSVFVRKDGNATIDMNNHDINYVNQLHFNAGVRFYDQGDDQYLNYKWNDTGSGGIRFVDGNSTTQGTVYGSGGGEFGLLDNDGSWAVRLRTGSNSNMFYCNSNHEMSVHTSYVQASASFRAPVFYDSNNTSYYMDASSTGTSIRCAGNIIAYYSDERLKDISGNIENAVGKVMSLNGFYYTANEKGQSYGYKSKPEVGLSAQEVQAVLPEVVSGAAIGDGYLTVDYAKVVPLLVEAIKEQQQQIDELKSLAAK
jgi:hypothetical protein